MSPCEKAAGELGRALEPEKPQISSGLYSNNPVIRSFFPPPHKDSSGFVIAGQNSNAVISKIETLTGIEMTVLDRRAQPHGGTSTLGSVREGNEWGSLSNPHIRQSGDGMVNAGESVREWMLKDNSWANAHNLTHQEIILPVLRALQLFEESDQQHLRFEHKGRQYQISGKKMGGSYKLFSLPKFDAGGNRISPPSDSHKSGWIGTGVQGSIFNDDLFADWVYTITDLETGGTLTGDALTPHLIYRYGFYQSGSYRNSPEKFSKFFHLI